MDPKNLLGALLQGGMSQSTGRRVEHAVGPQGLGGSGGLLGQLLGGGGGAGVSGTGGGGIGDLLGRLSGALGSGGQPGQGVNPLAMGGMGALAGAVLGRGRSSVGNAVGGGALALLGTLAWQALQKANQQKAAQGQAPQPTTQAAPAVPLGLRPPESPAEETALADQATILLRAMINAAKADGQIDGGEMQRIIGRLEEAGADNEARDFVLQELKKPLDLEGLVSRVSDPTLAAEVYAASLLAIEVDTPAERDYLQRLAAGLRLDPAAVQHLHQTLGAPG
jgi:uncharacterized membrane protein YebE (DUF533 family)